MHSAPLRTWAEELDAGAEEWDVLNPGEESFYSTTEEESYDDHYGWEWGRGHDGRGRLYWR
eukprot:2986710-Prorocentrum_lima.AAC.1